MEAYYPRCLRFARAVLQNPDDAEDMVQDTFVRLVPGAAAIRGASALRVVALSDPGELLPHREHGVSAPRRRARSTTHAAIERAPSTTCRRTALDDEWGEAVRRALADVPEHNREIFLLHYIEGFSYDEIERMTGVKQSALKMRVKRASDLLRKRLGRPRMTDFDNDPLLQRAIGELRRLPPVDADAVSRVVIAAAGARPCPG